MKADCEKLKRHNLNLKQQLKYLRAAGNKYNKEENKIMLKWQEKRKSRNKEHVREMENKQHDDKDLNLNILGITLM